jgi:hypothetical protein
MCGQPSSRKWNIIRHIDICHQGVGRFVSFMEYNAGRQQGFYPPSILKQAFQYHPNRKKINFLDTMQQEFWREIGRKQANLLLHSQSSIRNNQGIQSNRIWAIPTWQKVTENGNMNANAVSSSVNTNDIFGYRGQSCKDCLKTWIKIVYFEEDQKHNDHVCEGQVFGNINQNTQDLINKSRQVFQNFMPTFIKNSIMMDWSGKTIYLLAIKLSDPKSEKLTFKSSTKPNEKVTIRCELEKQVQLDLVNVNKNHWAARAIADNYSILNENELNDFLYNINNASFGVFNAHTEWGLKSYFMAVSIFNLQLPRDNNSNNTNS